jgi:hypothetical protein
MASRYQITVAGALSAPAKDKFAGLDVSSDGVHTVISGDFDQAALHALLERVRALSLELVGLRRLGRARDAQASR